MENRIKEQMCLFAYRLSAEEIKGNQLRLYLSALAYTLVEALRRLALKGTEWAEAQVDTIRLRLFKIGALVRIGARRVWLEMNSNYPWKHLYVRIFDALRCGASKTTQNGLFHFHRAWGPAKLGPQSDCGDEKVPPPSSGPLRE